MFLIFLYGLKVAASIKIIVELLKITKQKLLEWVVVYCKKAKACTANGKEAAVLL